MNYGRKGLAIHAISAVDLAIWDAYAKFLGQPISTLLLFNCFFFDPFAHLQLVGRQDKGQAASVCHHRKVFRKD